MSGRDLTRWNRAGLSRLSYVDGNAAVILERLRSGLHAAFPDWPAARPIAAGGSEQAVLEAIERLYAADPDDMLWQMTRAFARAGHVLAGTLDAYANEGYLATASQWESLRRLVAMLDYAPHPPSSASTPLALLLKPATAGKVTAGLQLRFSPPGAKPLLFETLEDIEADAALNALRPLDHDRNPRPLTGTRLSLEGRLDKLKTGEPVVLEDNLSRRLQAHLIQGVELEADRTHLTLTPPIAHADGLTLGGTTVHAQPKEKLEVLGPATLGAEVGRALHLATPPNGLAAGDIVAIGRPDAKPVYRRIKAVEADRLVFHEAVGQVDLAASSIVKPIAVPIAHLGGNSRGVASDGSQVRVLYVAGDWSWLSGRWLADVRHVSFAGRMREYLPLYECVKAHYLPVGTPSATDPAQTSAVAGYTALTLNWLDERDRAADGPDLRLANPQALLTRPQAAGPWRPDTFLQKSNNGRLSEPLLVKQPKKAAAGDVAVVVRGGNLAWTRLKYVAVDLDAELARLGASDGWQDRPGGPFYLTPTRVYSAFALQPPLLDARRNTTAVTGSRIDITLDGLGALPPGLVVGRAILAANGLAAVPTQVAEVAPAGTTPPWIRLAHTPPAGSTAENLVLHGNVVVAGHGETKPVKILGSGDGSRNNQRFLLDAAGVSFIPDPAMPTGVRADLKVSIGAETWTQVANLGASGPTDAHYQVRQSEDGLLWVEFGNGRNGRRLVTGSNNVRVHYRVGVGAAGNLAAGSLSQLAKPHAAVASVFQPIAASGGGERESPGALRENAAQTLLALERAVSLSDFASLCRGNAAIAQARAFSLPPGRGLRERLEVVVVPAGGGTLGSTLKLNLEATLMAHALPGVLVSVSSYQAVICAFEIVLRVRLDAFDGDSVRDAVRQALTAAFSRERRALGQALYRGEVYAVVEAVTGVENSFVSIDDTPALAPVKRVNRDPNGFVLSVIPQERQCVHLDLAVPGLRISVEEYSP